jgi:hypothetical protein
MRTFGESPNVSARPLEGGLSHLHLHKAFSERGVMKVLLIALVAIAILIFVFLRLFRREWADRLDKPSAETSGAGQAAASPEVERPISDLTGISITLKIDGEPFLFLLVAGDGATNRMGSGTFEDKNRHLFIGKAEPAIFEAVRSHVTPELLRISGGFEHKNRRGATCDWIVDFQFKDGRESGFGFRYGSESEGPPQEVGEFVTEAVRVTEPWYQDFKEKR